MNQSPGSEVIKILEPLAPLVTCPQSGVLPRQTARQGCEYGAQEISGHEFCWQRLDSQILLPLPSSSLESLHLPLLEFKMHILVSCNHLMSRIQATEESQLILYPGRERRRPSVEPILSLRAFPCTYPPSFWAHRIRRTPAYPKILDR